MYFFVTIILLAVVSFFLTLRSMRNFEEEPQPKGRYNLYLFKHITELNQELLHKLHVLSLNHKCLLSIEKLIKGTQSVVAVYAPDYVIKELNNIHLLELEDYLHHPKERFNPQDPNKIAVIDYSLGWELMKEKNITNLNRNLFDHLELDDSQLFFLQMILKPINKSSSKEKGSQFFNSTLRCMVVEPNHQKRVDLARNLDRYIEQNTGFKQVLKQPTKSIYESFKKRSFKPFRASKFVLSDLQILSLLGR